MVRSVKGGQGAVVLLIDAGNTSVTLGVSRGGRVAMRGRIPTARFTARDGQALVREAVGDAPVKGAVVASVVPRLDAVLARVARRAAGRDPLMTHAGLNLGVRIDYPRPGKIGADRLANAAGAADRYGTPVIVADFGTALTFDIVSAAGAYVGGVILPGLPLMTDYVAERTALLPRVDLKGRHGAIGRSTVGAMRLGAHLGYRGMVRELTTHLLNQDGLRNAALCATGGYAGWVLRGSGLDYALDANLTLYGLGRIYALNTEGEQ